MKKDRGTEREDGSEFTSSSRGMVYPALDVQSLSKEVSTNNCCKFMAILIVFPGVCLKQLQQLFSDNS